MFNTMESEFKIGGKLSPFKRDIKVFTAFREAGIATGAYYSKADWYSPFTGWMMIPSKAVMPVTIPIFIQKFGRYVSFVHRQK